MKHRYATERCIELIKRFEGFSPKPYLCPAGYWTIGYGHVITAQDKDNYRDPITEAEAEALLKKDVFKAEKAVLRLIKVPLTDGQFDALVDFVFNLGGGALQRSTLRAKLNRGEYLDAADEFLKWVWAGGRKLKGLVRRRIAERELFLS